MSTSATAQTELDRRNSTFWNELYGTTLARSLGIADFSGDALENSDSDYLGYYPYLLRYVEPEQLRSRDVLEVGLATERSPSVSPSLALGYARLDIASRVTRDVQAIRVGPDSKGERRTGTRVPAFLASDFVANVGTATRPRPIRRAEEVSLAPLIEFVVF